MEDTNTVQEQPVTLSKQYSRQVESFKKDISKSALTINFTLLLVLITAISGVGQLYIYLIMLVIIVCELNSITVYNKSIRLISEMLSISNQLESMKTNYDIMVDENNKLFKQVNGVQ